MLLVIPSEEFLAEGETVLDAAKSIREVWSVLQRAKVAFRIWVVVRHIGAAVRFDDSQIRQEERHGLGPHRRAAIGGQGQLARLDVLLLAGVGNQPLGQLRALARCHHPADHIPAEDIQNDIEVEVGPFGCPLQFGDVSAPELIRRSGQKLRLLIRRVGELIAALTSFTIQFQKAAHRAERTVIHAFVQQGGVDRGWRAVLEAFLMQIHLRKQFRLAMSSCSSC